MKLWIDGLRKPPTDAWTQVASAKEATDLLGKGGVRTVSLAQKLGDYDKHGLGSEVLDWIYEQVCTHGFVPPTIALHEKDKRIRRELKLTVRVIGRHAGYNAAYPTEADWKRFLIESETLADAAWRKEQRKIPSKKLFEYNMTHGSAPEHRPVAHYLLKRLKEALPELKSQFKWLDDENGLEDGVYRLYHDSFKTYHVQDFTQHAVDLFKSILPHQPLNEQFLEIVAEGTGKESTLTKKRRPPDEARRVVEAAFYAHYFLKMCAKYARLLPHPPRIMPSGWAAVLYLFDLR